MMEFLVSPMRPVLDASMRALCTKPYPNHAKGCPNYGRRDTCPPNCKLFSDVFNTNRDIWALWVKFDLGAHVEKMRKRHPKWTYRQKSCCLYWQGTVRKFLRERAEAWLEYYSSSLSMKDRLIITTCPEAMGVNVTKTMKQIEVTLEWPPKKFTRMVYLAGVAK